METVNLLKESNDTQRSVLLNTYLSFKILYLTRKKIEIGSFAIYIYFKRLFKPRILKYSLKGCSAFERSRHATKILLTKHFTEKIKKIKCVYLIVK